jgi:hypothetical protein
MTQPWEFLGYQKLTSSTGTVAFNNLWDSSAPFYNNMKFKLVAEVMTTNPSDLVETAAPYYYISTDGTSGDYDLNHWQAYDTLAQNGGSKNWTTSITENANNRQAFAAGSQNWCVTRGTTNFQRRYSSAEDNLQWGTYEVNMGTQHQIGISFSMKGINTYSRTNSTAMFNHVISSCGSAQKRMSSPSNSLYWNAVNYQFYAGSKFWVWGMRDTNAY